MSAPRKVKSGLPLQKPGDIFLLFHLLPYDFEAGLPLALGTGVCLERTPQGWLDSAEPGMADYLLPGFSLGVGLNNCCLRGYIPTIPKTNLTAIDLLFMTVIALRLHDPVAIRIGGKFQLGDKDNRFLTPNLYQLYSSAPSKSGPYTPKAFKAVGKIADRLLEVEQKRFAKLQSAILFFSHVSLGISTSYQLSYVGLFCALEALFVPTGKKAATLSKRVSAFLKNFQFPEDIKDWLEDEYINRRHKLAHGIHDAAFGMRSNPANHNAFERLHEITRLCLLGFLSIDDQTLAEHSSGSGNKLQQVIDKLGPASGQYIDRQQMWLN